MNTLANGGAAFFLYAFAFLEAEPKFKCQLNPDSKEWTYGTKLRPLEEEFCNVQKGFDVYNCEVDWDHQESIHNMLEQLNFYCAPKWALGLIGFCFLFGIVVGCLTITRCGDIYGRKPIYAAGLILHICIMTILLFSHNVHLDYGLLFLLGYSVTMRLYIGYTYNVEMQPKTHAVLASTI
jgi:hypothetical protein